MNFKKVFGGICLVALCAGFSRAEDKKKPWKNVTEASFVSSNGNSKTSNAAGKNTFNYDWTKTSLELIVGGLNAESEEGTTAEQYFASEKVTHKISDLNYVFEKYRWDKDRFAGIDGRHDASVGVGRELFKTAADLLIGEVGGGYIEEYRIGDEDKDFGTGRAYSKYTRTISATASFSQDAEYIHNMEDSDDFRVKTETSLLSALSTHLSLKIGFIWKHVGVPPAGFGRNDTITTAGIVATY